MPRETITYVDMPGESVVDVELTVSKAQELARTLRLIDLPYARLAECRRISADIETVVFDVDVQLGQHLANDIRRTERIAAVFRGEDTYYPETLALRHGFPHVPHLNIHREQYPRSLCLYDRPYSEIRLHWTALAYVERIREWLALTARGELHAEDQPLEQLLFGVPSYLVIPADTFDDVDSGRPTHLFVYPGPIGEEGIRAELCFAYRSVPGVGEPASPLKFIATTFRGAPQYHGIMHWQPGNLKELHTFLQSAGIDLVGELRIRLRAWERDPRMVATKLILLVALPKTRVSGGDVESVETWAFATVSTVGETGHDIGIWDLHHAVPGTLLEADLSKDGSETGLVMLNPVYALGRERAARLNGVEGRLDRKITAVGLGALGSQVFDNLARAGYGTWTLVDGDMFLPHNPTRHALHGDAVGFSKVGPLAYLANETIEGKIVSKHLVADVLDPGEAADQLQEAYADTEILLDMSASVPVARYLARDVESPARRASLYLSPSGEDLVLLVEDQDRRMQLDALEMQYYRALLLDPALQHHLNRAEARVRYGLACRDVTAIIPQDLVALHAAIGSRGLRTALASAGATSTIWRVNTSDLTVSKTQLPIHPVVEQQLGDWRVYADTWLLEKVMTRRREKLPRETGGVLIGTFDTQRQIIYVVDVLFSPPDSDEWPTVYVRGCQDLAAEIARVKTITAGALGYVGEWHSHPPGHGPGASTTDEEAIAMLAAEMAYEGLPALMLIAGHNQEHAWYLGRTL
ncbi:MAG TPA: Mov34/MPN/PAD-1 family protein [Chloroflexia bacterium]